MKQSFLKVINVCKGVMYGSLLVGNSGERQHDNIVVGMWP